MSAILEQVIHRGVEPVRWLIVAGIAYTLAVTVWTFFATPVSQPAASGPQGPTAGSQPERAPANVNWILSKHLFGEAGAQPIVEEDTTPAVETRLPLELQSVFIAEDPTFSAAIVAQKGKAGLLYQVGEKLPGNAELVDVTNTHIVLRRAGNRETLTFPQARNQYRATPGDRDAVPAARGAGNQRATAQRPAVRRAVQAQPANMADTLADELAEEPGDVLDQYRERLQEDADSALSELGIETNEGGGYRIGNVAQSEFLRRSGLQTGDVIVSVNGRPVGDVQSDQLELESLMEQGSARIEIQRGSRRFFITASLPNQ